MKLTLLTIICSVSLAVANNSWEQESCHESCLSLADHAKTVGSGANPVEETKKLCAKRDIGDSKCQRMIAMSKLVTVYIKGGVPKTRICRKVCERSRKLSEFLAEEKKQNVKEGATPCATCKTVVSYIEMGFKIMNQTEQEIIKSVDELCKTLYRNPDQAEKCQRITGYVDIIFRAIESGLDPKDICVKLQFCNESSTGGSPLGTKLAKVIKSSKAGNIISYYLKNAAKFQKELPSVIGRFKVWKKVEQKNGKLSNGTACKLCRTVTNIVYYSIKYANSTIEAVEEAVKAICEAEPKPIKKMCLFYLSKVDEIVQFIEKGLMPEKICEKLGFCKGMTSKEITTIGSLIPQFGKYKSKTPTICNVCDSVKRVIKRDMKRYTSGLRRLKKYLRIACSSPQSEEMNLKCMSIAPALASAEIVGKKLMDTKSCKKMVCNNALVVTAHLTNKTNNEVCDICNYAVKIVIKNFKDINEMIQGSLKEVDQACDLITYKQVATRCHQYVAGIETLFDEIVKKLSAENLCKDLNLCPNQNKQEEPFSFDDFFKFSADAGNPMCSFCKVAVKGAQHAKRPEVAKKALRKSCPGIAMFAGKEMCEKLEKHMDAIVGKKAQRESPATVCKKLEMCNDKGNFADVIGQFAKGMMDMFG